LNKQRDLSSFTDHLFTAYINRESEWKDLVINVGMLHIQEMDSSLFFLLDGYILFKWIFILPIWWMKLSHWYRSSFTTTQTKHFDSWPNLLNTERKKRNTHCLWFYFVYDEQWQITWQDDCLSRHQLSMWYINET
jgi:hypothetical protein